MSISISIIVPVHNSQDYICECIESIVNQTIENIEIICVCSGDDDSEKILYEYAKNDKRISVITDNNSSYGHKINVGIDAARGDYIGIVESDDFVSLDAFEKLLSFAKEKDLDFVKGDIEFFVDTTFGRITDCAKRCCDDEYHRVIELADEPLKRDLIGNNIWSGIYKRPFLTDNEIRLHESAGASYQDAGFAVLTACLAGRIGFISDVVYHYRKDNSFSSVKDNNKYSVIIDEFGWIEDNVKNRKIKDIEILNYISRHKQRSYKWNYERLPDRYRKLFVEDLCKRADKIIEDRREPYRLFTEKIKASNSIVVVCDGKYGRSVQKLLMLLNVDFAICDSNPAREGVLRTKDAVEKYMNATFFVAKKGDTESIISQLTELGVDKESIFICDKIAPIDNVISEAQLFCDWEL